MTGVTTSSRLLPGEPTSIRRTLLWALLPAAVFGVYASAFLTSPWAITWNDDWTQIFAFAAFLRDSLLDGELPVRSPWLGGGFPILGHPEYPVLSPFTPLVLLVGPILGVKLIVLVVLAAGAVGTFLYCRDTLGTAPESAAMASSLLIASGWTTAILESGNYPQIHYFWLPLMAWLLARPGGWRVDGSLAFACLIGATALTDGHLNTVILFGLVAVLVLAQSRRFAPRLLLFLGLTAALAAFKLLPTFALLRLEDRAIEDYAGGLQVGAFAAADFVGLACRPDGFALGPLPWLVAGVALLNWRRALPLLVLGGLGFWLALGPKAPVDLFWLITRLPVLGSIDAPTKYLVFSVGFAVIALAALGVDRAAVRFRPALAVAATLGAVVPLLATAWPTLTALFTEPDVPRVRRPYEPLITDAFDTGAWAGPRDRRPDLYAYYQKGIPLVRWEDNFRLPTGQRPAWTLSLAGELAPAPGYLGAAWTAEGPLQAPEWTANSVTVALSPATDGRLVTPVTINQNGSMNWRCAVNGGRDAGVQRPEGPDALLAVTAPVDATLLRCEYQSPDFRLGAWISALTALALIAAAVLASRRRAAEASPAP